MTSQSVSFSFTRIPTMIGLYAVLAFVSVVSAQDVTCVNNAYPPPQSTKIQSYVINLDLQPKERWTEVVKDKAPQLKALIKEFKTFLREISNKTTKIVDLLDKEGETICSTLPQPFADELRGIATATGQQLGEVVLFNLFYEVFTVCTSIIAQDETGKLFHARNMDFGLFMGWDIKKHTWEITEMLRPMVVDLDFQRSGKTVFKSVNFAGYIGLHTAIKPNLFTLSMNERFNVNGGYIGIIEWALGMRNARWMGFLTREVMENATSYDQAKNMLNNTVMLAPAYFILAGNASGQGCVITRDRLKAADLWEMKAASGWYILETNYDHWKSPLFIDNRRTPAHKCMDLMTQKNVSYKGIFNVLSSKPVLNKLTVYTALMQVSSGHLESYTQTCEDPCFPF